MGEWYEEYWEEEDDELPSEALRSIGFVGYVGGASVGRAALPDGCPCWGAGFAAPEHGVDPDVQRHLDIVREHSLPPVEAWRLRVDAGDGRQEERTLWLRKGSDFGRALSGLLRGYGPDARALWLKKIL